MTQSPTQQIYHCFKAIWFFVSAGRLVGHIEQAVVFPSSVTGVLGHARAVLMIGG